MFRVCFREKLKLHFTTFIFLNAQYKKNAYHALQLHFYPPPKKSIVCYVVYYVRIVSTRGSSCMMDRHTSVHPPPLPDGQGHLELSRSFCLACRRGPGMLLFFLLLFLLSLLLQPFQLIPPFVRRYCKHKQFLFFEK